MDTGLTKSEDAVNYVLWRLTQDGRLAYLIGYGTEAFRRLTEAQAERMNRDPKEYASEVWDVCKPVRVTEYDNR